MSEDPPPVGEWLLTLLLAALAFGAIVIVNVLTDGELGRWILTALR